MDKLAALKKLYRGLEHEDEMVGYLPALHLQPQSARRLDRHAAARLRARQHVDHMHPDAIIAIAASKNAQGADAGDLRRRDRLAALEAARVRARALAGEVLRARTRRRRASCSESHGLFTWGDDAKDCYETTLDIINKAIAWLAERDRGQASLRRRAVAALAGRPSGARSRRG